MRDTGPQPQELLRIANISPMECTPLQLLECITVVPTSDVRMVECATSLSELMTLCGEDLEPETHSRGIMDSQIMEFVF